MSNGSTTRHDDDDDVTIPENPVLLPNDYFERLTTPVRLANDVVARFTILAARTAVPREVLMNSCLEAALAAGWGEDIELLDS